MGRLLALAAVALAASRAEAYKVKGYPELVEVDPSLIPNLKPILRRGELALIESNKNGSLKQVSVIGLFKAPLQRVFEVLRETDRYREFTPNLVKSETIRVARTGNGQEFRDVDWEMEVPLQNLAGRNRYHYISPDTLHIWSIGRTNTRAIWTWRLYPQEGGETVAILHGFARVKDAGWMLRKLVKFNKKAEHGVMLAGALAFVKSLQGRAERLSGTGPKASRAKSSGGPRLNSLWDGRTHPSIDALEPLLKLGEVALIQSTPSGSLHQAVVMTNAYTSKKRIYDVALAVGEYDRFIQGVDEAEVTRDDGRTMIYEIEIKAPIFDIEYTAKCIRGRDWIHTRTIAGDLKDGQFRWEFMALGPQRTLALHYITADIRRSSWVLRQFVKVDPHYEHGFNVATALLMLSHVRGRAEGWLKPFK